MTVALYRSRDERMLGGVLGGMAKSLGWPVTRVRIAYVLLSILSAAFPGIAVYLVLWIVVPEEPYSVRPV